MRGCCLWPVDWTWVLGWVVFSYTARRAMKECVVCYSLDDNLLHCRHVVCDRCLPRLMSPLCPYCRTPILSTAPVVVRAPPDYQRKILLLCGFLWCVTFVGVVVFNMNVPVNSEERSRLFYVLVIWLLFIVLTWKNPFSRSRAEYEEDVFICLVFCLMPISCIVCVSAALHFKYKVG